MRPIYLTKEYYEISNVDNIIFVNCEKESNLFLPRINDETYIITIIDQSGQAQLNNIIINTQGESLIMT